MTSRKTNALTEARIRREKPGEKDRKLADGHGLYLLIRPGGSKLWRLKYRMFGKERLLAIGDYPRLDLLEARRLREQARRQIAAGIDPVQARRTQYPKGLDIGSIITHNRVHQESPGPAFGRQAPEKETMSAPHARPPLPRPSLTAPPWHGTVGPIARGALYEEVVTRVRDMIVDGRLAAGTVIPELELAGMLGISRTPLREALKVLATEGLVELMPRRGAVVTKFTAKDAQEMLALIAMLEDQAGRQACREASDSDLIPIFDLHQRMREHYERGERYEYFLVNQQIHDAIIRAAGNATLTMLHGILRARMRRIRYMGNAMPRGWSEAMNEHEAFIAALRVRDQERVGRLMHDHLMNTWPRILAAFNAVDQGL